MNKRVVVLFFIIILFLIAVFGMFSISKSSTTGRAIDGQQKPIDYLILNYFTGKASVEGGEGWTAIDNPIPCTSVSQWGITWTFSESETCGQFANGDWWVLAPVTVVSVSPAQATGRHGSWVNPTTNLIRQGGYSAQPFDSRAGQGGIHPYTAYEPTLRPTYPITFNSAASLVSTESSPEISNCPGNPNNWLVNGSVSTPCSRSLVKKAAVLTIMDTIPPSGSFRPPYIGTNKTVMFNKDMLNYSILGKLPPTPRAYPLSTVERMFERVNLQIVYWPSEMIQPTENSAGYGREVGQDVSVGALALNLNYTDQQKEKLLIGYVQRGIDTYGSYKDGNAFYSLGGHGGGRFFPILFAGVVLNDPEMKGISSIYDRTTRFSEYGQIFKVDYYPPGTPLSVFPGCYPVRGMDCTLNGVNGVVCASGGVNCGTGGYNTSEIGFPDFGTAHVYSVQLDDHNWASGTTSSDYRECCTANAWGGFTLASYVMGIEDLWNYPVFFAYMDRYKQFYPRGNYKRFWDSWDEEMWDTYRANYGRQWNSTDLCTEYTTRSCAKQLGVCAGSTETCTFKNWWGCEEGTYSSTSYVTNNPNYQLTETSCDGLDNDCDGIVDEGCGAPTVPQNPYGLSVTTVNSSSLLLSWVDNSTNENYFTLQRRQLPSGSFANISAASNLPVNTNAYTDNGLVANTAYEYRVRAVNSVGASVFSNTASATTNQTPVINFSISANPASGGVQQGTSVQTTITANYISGPASTVSFSTTNLSTGLTPTLNQTSCTLNGASCSITLTISASALAQLVSGQQIVITGTSGSVTRQLTYRLNVTNAPVCISGQVRNCPLQLGVCAGSTEACINNNWLGCTLSTYQSHNINYFAIETGVAMCTDGLDNDCDGLADLGRDSGCPLPSSSNFSSNITTNFSTIRDFTRVENLSVGILGLGRIQYLGQEVSLWRFASGIYQATNLNNAVTIRNNLIGVNSESYSELNQTATLTFYNMSYSQSPTPLISTGGSYAVCPSTKCSSVNYSNGNYVLVVAGFSNYSTQPASCGDSYCNLEETCSSCSADCGSCPSNPSGSGGGSSGGGGGGGGSGGSNRRNPTPITNGALITQCNDGIDNDGDRLRDYPADPGCSNAEDNIELDASLLVSGNESAETSTLTSSNRASYKINPVLLTSMVILILAIIVMVMIILRYYKIKKLEEFLRN